MRRLAFAALAALLFLALSPALKPTGIAGTAFAVEPSEMLQDPNLEARARKLSEGLRCLVCQNQSIDDSNADLARDLRVLVRERIKAGDSDEQVKDYLVDRYGEFVLLRPVFDWTNLLLWGTPLIVLVIGGIVMAMRFRRTAASAEPKLSAEEEARLADLLEKDAAS
ncbi:cytochrome c-type biogenesis protein [Afifella sp. IM 167]|uniref:cytochrome c-type biogenesis protein n=1 Tax=Afifella sp. IM 167 TaxID=2033586 RepID=UPI001CCF8DBF|nr:cytochrome c-type biogenesis protein [Afifella sp. IM 167]MBZ8133927.1 cytochrome C biogenesis protein [Afifella sp. IM 167]